MIAKILSLFKRQEIEYVSPFSVAVMDHKQRRFTPSFSLTVGGRSSVDLIRAVRRETHEKGMVCLYCGLETTPEAQRVDFVHLAISDLGLSVGNSRWSMLSDEFCSKWSRENLNGQEIGLCKREDAPQLRLQYRDQPIGQCISFAMKAIPTTGGDYPMMFWIGRGESGRRFLTAENLIPYVIYRSSLIFRLRTIQATGQ